LVLGLFFCINGKLFIVASESKIQATNIAIAIVTRAITSEREHKEKWYQSKED
jgi:hypothetical protein